MALFQGSDRTSEYYDSHDMLYGGTGIITKDGILKPAGFAFDFLNRLLPYYIGKEENCILTTDGHGSYGILCHNAKKLNYNYYLSAEMSWIRRISGNILRIGRQRSLRSGCAMSGMVCIR